jgi:hypothetical protein
MNVVDYLGASNISKYRVYRDGNPFDLVAAGVTRIEIVERGKVLSSDNSGEVEFSNVTEDLGNGLETFTVLSVNWGSFDLPAGHDYLPTIYAYKANDTKGEAIMGQGIETIYLTLLANERP